MECSITKLVCSIEIPKINIAVVRAKIEEILKVLHSSVLIASLSTLWSPGGGGVGGPQSL